MKVLILRIAIHLVIALSGLAAMVVFVQHQPDSDVGMKYIYFYCIPVLAAFTVLVSSLAIRDYLHPNSDDGEDGDE